MTVNSISADHWTTSERVHDKLEVQRRGEPPAVDQDIADATDSVQARALDRGFFDSGDDLPETEADLPDLLIQATTYWAIYEGYGTLSNQLQGSGSGGDDVGGQRFKELAKSKLDDAEALLTNETTAEPDQVESKSVTTTSRSDSLMEW